MDKPAILGGKRVLEEPLPIMKPTLPELFEIKDEISEVLFSGMITNYKFVKGLEKRIAEYLGVRYAVAVSSCTSGLMLAVKALELTGEVVVPSFTFVATVHSLLWNNLTPVFVDCDPETFNIDPSLVEEKITSKTTTIMGVHVFGNPCDINVLKNIADKHDLRLIFDAAHAFGSKYQDKLLGNSGDVEVFSLSPIKIVTACEGGVITTSNSDLADKTSRGRDYGNYPNYDCRFPGLSARMSELNAIIGIKSLEMLERNLKNRQQLAQTYKSELNELPGITVQKIKEGCRSTYAQGFHIIIEPKKFGLNRDELALALQKENIMTKKMYFYPPIHKQRAYSEYLKKYSGKLPVTEHLSENILSLPMFSHLEKEKIQKICFAIRRIYKYGREVRSTCQSILA